MSVRVGTAISTEHDPLEAGTAAAPCGRRGARRRSGRSRGGVRQRPAPGRARGDARGRPGGARARARSSAAAPAACSAPAASSSPARRSRCGRRRSTSDGAATPFHATLDRRRARAPRSRVSRPRRARAARCCSPTRTRSRPTPCSASLAEQARRPCRCSAASPAPHVGRRGRCSSAASVHDSGAVGVSLAGRRDAPVRLAGRGAARPRGDDHRRRGQHHPRARWTPGAPDRRADHLRAVAARARAGRGRAADRGRDRRRQARVRAGRLPRPRRARRRPRDGQRSSSAPQVAQRPGGAAARSRRALGRRGPAARRCSLRVEALAGETPGRRARVLVQRPRHRDVRRRPTTTPRRSSASWAARPPPGSSPPGRSDPVGGRSFLHGFTATLAVFPG